MAGQKLYRHTAWETKDLESLKEAWYQREIVIRANWTGRRITVYAEYVNSYVEVYLDGKMLGKIYFPWGEVDITAGCQPGGTHLLSLRVMAMPLG